MGREKAIVVVMLAAGVVLCGILYSVINGHLASPDVKTPVQPWSYTTLPMPIPTVVNEPSTLILNFPNLNLRGRDIPGLTSTSTPRETTPTTVKQPSVTTTTIPKIISVPGLNQTLCKSLPALCGVTGLLDNAATGAGHLLTGK